eukprot:TCALIF_03019-PA protein Name:"Similar to Stt3b Dolichyl-diphosphooligosaccharide--protein glycosyltransferase subunit STT3B (Mus musculus)" AED:0.93 eAED:0.93 QI:0/0/0/0.33/1/1/3/0/480
MDSLMQSKEEPLDRREERLREQMRFDTNRILAVLREHETLLIQDVETAPNASNSPPEPSPSLPPESNTPNQGVVATPKDRLSGSDSRSLQSGPSIPKSVLKDQLDQFGKNHLNKIESRLAALETSVTSVDANVKHIQERAHVWDTFQHHVTAWADLMRTLDSKVDHLGRSQTEKLTTTTDQLFNMQSNWDAGLAHVKARLQKIESSIAAGHDPSVAFTARGILSTLKRVESKLDAVVRKESRIDSTDEGRPSKTHCRDVSASLADISERLEYLEDHIRESQFREPEYISDYEIGGEMSELSVTSPTLDNQIMRAMRRMTVPLKRIHKRLRTLDTMEHKFEGILAQMDQSIDGATHDIEGKFNDFFNMTMEMFEHQHLQVEKQGLNSGTWSWIHWPAPVLEGGPCAVIRCEPSRFLGRPSVGGCGMALTDMMGQNTGFFNPAGTKSLIVFVVLALAWIVGFASRLFAVIRFESIIHEFDPW